MIFRKNFKKGGGGHFRSEKFHCKFGAVWSGLRKKSQYILRKRGGGQGPFGNFIGFAERWLLLMMFANFSTKGYNQHQRLEVHDNKFSLQSHF